MFGELALRDQDLTASAQAAPAAHRIDVHAQRARGTEHRRTRRKMPTLARGHEDDQRILAECHGVAQLWVARRRWPPSRRPRGASPGAPVPGATAPLGGGSRK